MIGKRKILLVDDVRLFLRLEETFFKRTGCDILTASTGKDALGLAREHHPDLILLDYNMPDMMGDAILAELKGSGETASIPVMMVTTSSKEEHVQKCMAAGADEYVTKPINAQELLSKAASLLNIPQRVHRRIPVRVEVAGETEGASFTGWSRNISQGGVLLECGQNVAPGAVLTLSLPIMDEGENLHLHGRAVRTDRDESQGLTLLGVQFLEPTPDQQRVLKEFLGKQGGS